MQLSDKMLTSLPEDSRNFIKEFFLNAPNQLGFAMNTVTFATGEPLMNTFDRCTYVYILLKGRLKAIEERICDTPYHFTEIMPIEIVGDYELFTGAKGRYVTVAAAEPSLLLAIQAGSYLSWIRQDANALFLRTRMLLQQVSAQGLSERQRFFWDNRARFLSFLTLECRKAGETSFPHRVKYNREELSSLVGCSVRTSNRIIKQLIEEGLIGSYRGKIRIEKKHYDRILEHIENLKDSKE